MRPAELRLGGERLLLDPAGVLFWPRRRMLVVADLHLEKGAAFARRGVMLPPHDTIATIERLEAVLARLDPATVVSLGDGFHDLHGPAGLPDELAERLRALTRGREWLWVSGNHDPMPPMGLGGIGLPEAAFGGIALRHEAENANDFIEIIGHLHPKAKLRLGRATARLGCFVTDGSRLVLPAFGAFTGGLNVLDEAFARILDPDFQTYVLGRTTCRRIARHLLLQELSRPRQVAAIV
ncbi:ligase-associated DNA damage response endonuclease PdeM [Geminicoccus flavidas]|uniref:ligase-associated DNA damage response endonuclease PdeM n=1 Tax=Geminicoccus flavidas TaxID=2506407 RepID=UPI001F15CDC6|nr:ligase-associated DNA damage response endonuclease PdeM [Geminicoccus flavidas]